MRNWIGRKLIRLGGFCLVQGLRLAGFSRVHVAIEGHNDETRGEFYRSGQALFLADNGTRERIFETADEARDWLIATEAEAEPNTGVFVTRFVGGEYDGVAYPTFPIDPKGPLFPVQADAA